MSIAEWALRTMPHAWFKECQDLVDPIAYGLAEGGENQSGFADAQAEWYYMQADLTGTLRHQLNKADLGALPLLELALRNESVGIPVPVEELDTSIKLTQIPRLWLSPGGAISPLHFDLSPMSHLVQVHGSKAMAFYAPEQLKFLRPFPSGHMLARRCETNLQDAAASMALLARSTTLFPGDIILFASMWSHYTASLSASSSITFRMEV